jgi:hypothetical protein
MKELRSWPTSTYDTESKLRAGKIRWGLQYQPIRAYVLALRHLAWCLTDQHRRRS